MYEWWIRVSDCIGPVFVADGAWYSSPKDTEGKGGIAWSDRDSSKSTAADASASAGPNSKPTSTPSS